MIRRRSGERRDARNADNQIPGKLCRRARKLLAIGRVLRPLALAVYPLGLYGIEPRTLLGQKAAHYPHSAPAVLDFSVVRSEPAPDLPGDVEGSVVPDEKQHS